MDTQYTKERHTLLWSLLKQNAPKIYHELSIKRINKLKKENAKQLSIK